MEGSPLDRTLVFGQRRRAEPVSFFDHRTPPVPIGYIVR